MFLDSSSLQFFSLILQETSAIILFFYSIEKFSATLMKENLKKLEKLFSSLSNTVPKGLFSGFISTAFLQSSTAVSALAVSLVNVGIFSVNNAMPIIFGASIGTSITALLVSLKMKLLEEILISFGFLISLNKRMKSLGLSIFYLGLVLFSIEQIGIVSLKMKDYYFFKYVLLGTEDPFLLFLLGVVVTIILQSSSLVTSILVLLISSQDVNVYKALYIANGAFLGTTITSLVISLNMSNAAKITARLNFGISFLASVVNLFFINFIFYFINLFKDNSIAFAFANTLNRFILAIFSIIIFTIWKNYFNKKKQI